jgi:Ala-tRNA(Pro) deacylase
MPSKKLKEFLDKNNVRYISFTHSKAFTAQEIAASAHVPGKSLAKTVVVWVDNDMAMCVLPASYRVDTDRLEAMTAAEKVRLADEQEFRDRFPDCEIGAMSPFGNLYGFDVYVAESLAEDEIIAFNAGTHTELIQLAYRDFERLVRPHVIRFSQHI